MSDLSITKYFPFMRVKITKQTVHHEDASSTMIKFEPDRRYRPFCHTCGAVAANIHSHGYRRFIRDLNMANAQTWLHIEYRKVWCNNCKGARVERLEFVDASQRVTHRLAQYIYDLCKVMTVKEVATHLELDPKTVKNIDKTFLEKDFGETDYSKLRIIAIDEIAVKKGHNYMTVIMNYFTGKIIWMGQGRDKETLDSFFEDMTDAQKQAIEAVAMDMWEPYINRIKHHCPNANIVFDFFHVVQAFGKVIDKVRRDEYVNANKDEQKVLKGSRYLLLKNENNLNQDQQDHLKKVLELNFTLNTLYVLKDHLKLIFHYSEREIVKNTLDDWCKMASQVDHPSVNAFVKRLRFFEYGILNHADYPIGTSQLEGANNKIKVIKRKAYGFHDLKYFTLKVKQAFAA